MKTNWLKRTLMGVAASAALIGVAAYAQGAFNGGPPSAADMAAHQARMLEHIGKHLDLNAAQQAKLQVLANTLHAQHQTMMAGDPHARMQALIAGNTFDRAGAQQLVNEKVQQVQANSPAIIAAAGDFFDSLNPTQQQQLREMAAHHHGFLPFGPGGFGEGGPHGHHGPHGASAPSGN